MISPPTPMTIASYRRAVSWLGMSVMDFSASLARRLPYLPRRRRLYFTA
jgi:hypothetical protein